MKLRILIIDDNPDDRLLIVRKLSREFPNLEVQEILDNPGLVAALEAGNFDLVVTDYQLRWTNGLKILHNLKTHYPECPVVMFTNSGNEEVAVAAMKAGLDDYVTKSPNHYIRLCTAVRSVWERTQAQRRASDLQTELQSLLNRLNVGVFRATLPGQLLQGNAAFLHLLGAIALPDAETILSRYWPAVQAQLSHAPGNSPKEKQAIEIHILRPDGTDLWVALSATQCHSNGKILVDGLLDDISDRKRVEAERAEMLAREQAARTQAEAASRLKDEFLAIVSHELRSPLNAMLGWATLLRSRKFDAAKTQQALESIERNARAQTQLIEDLLDISRLIRGKLRLSVGTVELTPIIAAAIETVRLAAEAKDIELRQTLSADIGPILGDPNRLQQVIWNLLSNAVKFTHSGGWVEVKLQAVNGYAEIQVIDNGKGIDPEFLPYVFEHFRQEDSTTTRSVGGLGLGLAIVRQLVEMHGGRVSASSVGEGYGSTFTIMLPLHHTQEPANPLQKFVQDSSHPQLSPLSGLRVLVVDDEEDVCEYLVVVMEEYGAKVKAVTSAAQARSAINHWQPDILISDIGMPVEDGYSLIRQLRANGEEIPAVALTAYAREEDAQSAIAAGFQIHLTKPIEPNTLLNAIAQLRKQEINW